MIWVLLLIILAIFAISCLAYVLFWIFGTSVSILFKFIMLFLRYGIPIILAILLIEWIKKMLDKDDASEDIEIINVSKQANRYLQKSENDDRGDFEPAVKNSEEDISDIAQMMNKYLDESQASMEEINGKEGKQD